MSDPDDNAPLPADLRFLKVLVTALAGVMMLGLLAIVWLLVTRLGVPTPLPTLPDTISLPTDTRPAAITFARDWLVVVTETGEILLYDRDSGTLQSRTQAP